jgi:hypothetical protein
MEPIQLTRLRNNGSNVPNSAYSMAIQSENVIEQHPFLHFAAPFPQWEVTDTAGSNLFGHKLHLVLSAERTSDH